MATANNVMSEKIICLTLPHLCACPKAGHVIPMPYNVIIIVLGLFCSGLSLFELFCFVSFLYAFSELIFSLQMNETRQVIITHDR
jgi:hypothetical protein